MSKVKHLRKEEQEIGTLFNGAFTENKPIGFPTKNGTDAYSNIFYWAHLVADETAEFPLHPHEGFEIMTFVLKGTVEHYDTVSKVYTPLNAGDVQAMQAGSGVSHSERIHKGTQLFQIWFDPDFSRSMPTDATYKDYMANSFHSQNDTNKETLTYVGNDGLVKSITEGLEIKKITYKSASFDEPLDPGFTYSYYLLDGKLKLDGETLAKDDFYVLKDAKNVTLKVQSGAELFVIKTPTNIKYRSFMERYTRNSS